MFESSSDFTGSHPSTPGRRDSAELESKDYQGFRIRPVLARIDQGISTQWTVRGIMVSTLDHSPPKCRTYHIRQTRCFPGRREAFDHAVGTARRMIDIGGVRL